MKTLLILLAGISIPFLISFKTVQYTLTTISPCIDDFYRGKTQGYEQGYNRGFREAACIALNISIQVHSDDPDLVFTYKKYLNKFKCGELD